MTRSENPKKNCLSKITCMGDTNHREHVSRRKQMRIALPARKDVGDQGLTQRLSSKKPKIVLKEKR